MEVDLCNSTLRLAEPLAYLPSDFSCPFDEHLPTDILHSCTRKDQLAHTALLFSHLLSSCSFNISIVPFGGPVLPVLYDVAFNKTADAFALNIPLMRPDEIFHLYHVAFPFRFESMFLVMDSESMTHSEADAAKLLFAPFQPSLWTASVATLLALESLQGICFRRGNNRLFQLTRLIFYLLAVAYGSNLTAILSVRTAKLPFPDFERMIHSIESYSFKFETQSEVLSTAGRFHELNYSYPAVSQRFFRALSKNPPMLYGDAQIPDICQLNMAKNLVTYGSQYYLISEALDNCPDMLYHVEFVPSGFPWRMTSLLYTKTPLGKALAENASRWSEAINAMDTYAIKNSLDLGETMKATKARHVMYVNHEHLMLAFVGLEVGLILGIATFITELCCACTMVM